ncbi:M23 family metallopeptidase [Geodermatophilus sp. SYSU D00766]
MPGPRTGAHRRAAARPVSPLRGFPPVRPADPAPRAAVLPAPRAADHDVVAGPDPAVLPTAVLPVEGADAPATAAVPAPVAADPVPVRRRRGLRDRRPSLLVAALVAGAVGAAVVGVPGSPEAAAEPTPVLGAMELATGDEAVEVMPMASITEAEAQARLEEVAASRAERAAAEAAAAEAAAAAAEAARPKAVLPVDGARFTSGFGSRWGTFHYGIDLAAPIGTPEYAAADGVVVRAGAASGFGLAVYVLHENGDVTVYGHMEEILVEPGQYVEAGETIALLGNRGQSTGPHLHFEVHEGGMDGKRIDPVGWLAERGVEI